jgi:subtilisin family serine protease
LPLFTALLSATIGCGYETAAAPSAPTASVQAELSSALETAGGAPDDAVAVIVNLREALPAHSHPNARRDAIGKMQDDVISTHWQGFTLSRRYGHVPALAGRLTKDGLERLRRDPRVSYIQLDTRGSGQLKEAVPAIGADKVKSMLNLTGRGVRVAVLDTGVDTTHPDLMDSVVAQHCFTQGDCPPLRLDEGTSAEDDHGHGSNVTGIITSNGVVSSPGFAPDAEIIAVKVDDFNDSGQESDWVSGLDWVYENLSTLKVNVINLSICSNQLYADAAECDLREPALAAAVKNLIDAGVTIFSASGNRGSTTTMSAPACNTGVIAVGATYDSSVGHQPPTTPTYSGRWGGSFANCGDDTTAFDQITCFTNSPKRLDLVAPGAPMLSDTLNGMTEAYWGTSQASPVAAGVAALMLQCDPKLTPAAIKQAMLDTGVPRVDAKDGMSFPSLRALDAVLAVCKGDAGASVMNGGVAGMPAGGAGGGGVAGQSGAGGAVGNAGGGVAGSAGAGFGGAGVLAPPPGGSGIDSGSGGQLGATTGGATGTDLSATGTIERPTRNDDKASCSCDVVGSSRGRTTGAPWLLGLAFAIGGLRLRRRSC